MRVIRIRRGIAGVALALLALGLAACNTVQTVVPNAAVLINPTPGLPSVYNGMVVPAPGGPFPGPCCPPPIPCCPGTPAPPTNCQTHYTVQCGDTLSSISLRFGVSVQAIAAANNITNPNLIFVDQVLCIPPPVGPTPRVNTPTPTPTGPTRTPAPTRTPTPTRTPGPSPVYTATPGSTTKAAGAPFPSVPRSPEECKVTCTRLPGEACYVVRQGDTLGEVAALCKVSEAQILYLNRPELDSARTLKPNREIIIKPRPTPTPTPSGPAG
ncbi:MAG: LysM peptidoglycan-binding domain-containing protein [Anaerolineae bacterium]